MKDHLEPEHTTLDCECGEKLVLLGSEDDWRSRRAIFRCDCGRKLILDDCASQEIFAAS
jgi:hypothetical protein